MKIDRPDQSSKSVEIVRSALREVLQVSGNDKNVSCWMACPCPERKDSCGHDCPGISTALSSDPQQYPLEIQIAPLVYELSKMRVYQPCWSCEGHETGTGDLWKLPQIWFYAGSDIQARLMADALRTLLGARALATEWEVAITRSAADDPETTYCLKPATQEPVKLDQLQRDLTILTKQLPEAIRQQARNMLAAVN